MSMCVSVCLCACVCVCVSIWVCPNGELVGLGDADDINLYRCYHKDNHKTCVLMLALILFMMCWNACPFLCP